MAANQDSFYDLTYLEESEETKGDREKTRKL